MNNEIIEIKKENVIAVYRAASEDNQELLKLLFGEELFKPKDITDRIKTFYDAYNELGEDNKFVKEYDALIKSDGLYGELSENIIAYLKLCIICAALNEGWKPKFTKDEYRYYPSLRFYISDEIDNMKEKEKQDLHLISTDDYETEYAGFAFAYSFNAPSNSTAHFGSRLCLKNNALAEYCGKQFTDIWADYLLVRR